MRIYATKKMIALNERLNDLDTQRGVFLTPAGWAVRTIHKTMELMEYFGFTGPELNYMGLSLKAIEAKKKALVVSDEREQYKDWYAKK